MRTFESCFSKVRGCPQTEKCKPDGGIESTENSRASILSAAVVKLQAEGDIDGTPYLIA